MTVTAPPLDLAGAALDAQIATVQALLATGVKRFTADSTTLTMDSTTITADLFSAELKNIAWLEQLLNQLQVEAVDHYMVTGWLNAAVILAQYPPPVAWDEVGQELQARVAYLTAIVANPPAPPAGTTGYQQILLHYQGELYAAQITLVEHVMDLPGGTPAATILANMSGNQSFPFAYNSNSALPPSLPSSPIVIPPTPPPPPPPTTYQIGGTLSGLAAGNSITLRINGGETLTLSSNGAFIFPTRLTAGASYSITVLTAPAGQAVSLSNSAGTASASSVSLTQVTAAPSVLHTIGGTLSGLTGIIPVVLQNNGAETLSLTSNGAFVFATPVANGQPYSVTVLSGPPTLNVTLTNSSGTVSGANVSNVGVSCAAPAYYNVGGSLVGMGIGGVTADSPTIFVDDLTATADSAATSITLQNNGGDDVTLNADGSFVFPTKVLAGAAYSITVSVPPLAEVAVVTNGSGVVGNADVTNAVVTCSAAPTYSVGGTLASLPAGKTITLQNNGVDNITLGANGAFTFPTKLAAGTAYNVTVLTPPAGGDASVANGAGTMPAANVTNVGVACIAAPVYTVGGTLSGLTAGKSIVLQCNGTNNLTLSANGAFTFITPLADGATYTATTLTPPSGETVAITNGTGTISGANVTNVGAACTPTVAITRRYSPGIYVALSYADCGQGPNGDTLSADTGTFSYAAGTAAVPLTITGNYSSGTIPGGKNGTGTSTGCSKGSGAGGHTLSRWTGSAATTTGPCVNVDASHRVAGVVPRYPWNDIETSQGVYDFTRMDADLAQCISLDVMWFPLPVFHTFGPNEARSVAQGNSVAANPIPEYLAAYRSSGSGGIAVWRWDNTNVVPRSTALITKICQRYDQCSHFGGVALQETSTSGADTVAHNFSTAGYLTALSAEADAHGNASPNSRLLPFQNFGGSRVPSTGTVPSVMIDQYAAYIQKWGAILAGPDTVLCGGSVYTSCYTSGSGTQAGRYHGYRYGGTIGSGVYFSSTGPIGCSIQRAEWIGIAPACTAGQSVQNALDYLLGSTTVSTLPNFLGGASVLIMDWHQGAGSPNNQEFTPDGVNLVKNNAISRFSTWTVT